VNLDTGRQITGSTISPAKRLSAPLPYENDHPQYAERPAGLKICPNLKANVSPGALDVTGNSTVSNVR
jgi:hypothetical protein